MVVSFSGLVNAVAGAGTYAGVNQTTPLGTFAGATGTSTAPSVSPATVANDLVFDTVIVGDTTLTVGANQTSRWNVLNTIRGAASTEAATTTSTTMSWTAGASDTWAVGAVPIKPSAGPTRTATLAAYNTLVSTGGSVTLEATFTNTSADNSVTPGTPTITTAGGASCGSLSGPALVSSDNDISGSGDPVVYRWTCAAAGGTSLPSSVQFSVGATGASYTYPSGTSNTVLVARR